MTGREIEKL